MIFQKVKLTSGFQLFHLLQNGISLKFHEIVAFLSVEPTISNKLFIAHQRNILLFIDGAAGSRKVECGMSNAQQLKRYRYRYIYINK